MSLGLGVVPPLATVPATFFKMLSIPGGGCALFAPGIGTVIVFAGGAFLVTGAAVTVGPGAAGAGFSRLTIDSGVGGAAGGGFATVAAAFTIDDVIGAGAGFATVAAALTIDDVIERGAGGGEGAGARGATAAAALRRLDVSAADAGRGAATMGAAGLAGAGAGSLIPPPRPTENAPISSTSASASRRWLKYARLSSSSACPERRPTPRALPRPTLF